MTPEYQADGVTLYRGDALDVLRRLPDGCVDAVVTDPPYKLSQEYSSNADPDNLLAVSSLWPAAAEMLRVVKAGALCLLFYDMRILPLAIEAMRRTGWTYLRCLTLYRRWGHASMMAGWMSTSDLVLVYAKPGARPQFHGKAAHDVYLKDRPEGEGARHPAQKPLAFCKQLVARVCPLGGTVLDPFMGSGTTGTACVQTGRRFIGMEIEPDYFEVARKRLAEAEGPLFASREEPA